MIDSKKVKEIRLNNELTQEEFAQRLDVTHQYISMLETGSKTVSPSFERKLEKAGFLPTDKILSSENEILEDVHKLLKKELKVVAEVIKTKPELLSEVLEAIVTDPDLVSIAIKAMKGDKKALNRLNTLIEIDPEEEINKENKKGNKE